VTNTTWVDLIVKQKEKKKERKEQCQCDLCCFMKGEKSLVTPAVIRETIL
jgi:hypothetical protein